MGQTSEEALFPCETLRQILSLVTRVNRVRPRLHYNATPSTTENVVILKLKLTSVYTITCCENVVIL